MEKIILVAGFVLAMGADHLGVNLLGVILIAVVAFNSKFNYI
jgi:hypothetical protein|tara:strand:+ start:1265 stop:1390 length:126 start_codon:yes stop_codon:yes gene_type:complete